MSEKIKHDFYMRVIRQVALESVPLKNGSSSPNFGEEAIFIISSVVKNDHKCPNKMVVCSGGRFLNFIQGLKEASFI